MDEKRNKRKREKLRKPFSSLIKKSCKKLEEEEPIRAFKRLGKIPRAWLTASSDSASASAPSAWTVTDSESTSCSNVTAVNTSQDWTITDLLVNEKSSSKSSEDSPPFSSDALIDDESKNSMTTSITSATSATVGIDKTARRLDKRKLRVSFSAEAAAQCTYEAETGSTADSSVRPEDVSVVVPQSAVKSLPNLLKHGNYTVVDFSPKDDDPAGSVNHDRIVEENADAKQQVSIHVSFHLEHKKSRYGIIIVITMAFYLVAASRVEPSVNIYVCNYEYKVKSVPTNLYNMQSAIHRQCG